MTGAPSPGASVATVSVWRVRRRHVAGALAQVAAQRRRRPPDGQLFARLVGTAGDGFTPLDARPTCWALLAAWTDEGAAHEVLTAGRDTWWDRHAVESGTLLMRPVWSRGSWGGRQPFGEGDVADESSGPVVALTRSTVRVRRALRFYHAVPAVARDVRAAPGLRLSFGIGESPLLHQGTVSVWDDLDAMRSFAHRTRAHVDAVRATPDARWYAEEMFTRFRLLDATGSIHGRDPSRGLVSA
jgi:hypothetical protein